MPEIKVKQVVTFSSEDQAYPAENLLQTDSFKKWKCRERGERELSVTLRFEEPSKIEGVHIGNEGSAFVEVLVGRSGSSNENFEVLLPTSSFMTPVEARNGSPLSRVRLFTRDKLTASLVDQKWDLVQVVCNQPFTKTLQYGLSFIKFLAPEKPVSNKDAESSISSTKIGGFTLKTKECDDIPIGGTFARRKELNTSLSSGLIRGTSYERVVVPREPVNTKSDTHLQEKNVLYQLKKRETDTKTTEPEKKKIKLDDKTAKRSGDEKVIASSEKEIKRTPKSSEKKAKHTPESSNKNGKQSFDKQSVCGRSSQSSQSIQVKKPSSVPFDRVLKDVVFTMSGYQNPLRGQIRDKALRMGAKYKPDWTSDCTHLVCAFQNTPKYSQVRGKGKIATKDWIEQCFVEKKRLPWRRFALNPDDRKQPESDDDLPKDETLDVDEYGGSTDDDVDTDDEIQAVRDSEAKGENGKQQQRTFLGTNSSAPGKSEETSGTKSPISSKFKETKFSTSSKSTEITGTNSKLEETPGTSTTSFGKIKESVKESTSTVIDSDSDNVFDADTDVDEDVGSVSKPDTSDLPLPKLPDFFINCKFLIYGEMQASEQKQVERFVIAYGGSVCDYMNDDVKYVVTNSKWDENFDKALEENPELIFVRPKWLMVINQKQKRVPYQPYMVTKVI